MWGERRDDEAFKRLVDQTWPQLVRTARLLTGDDAAAEDLAQNALVKTYEHWGSLRAPEAASAYARTTLVRDCVRWRTRNRREERRAPDALPERLGADPYDSTGDALRVRRALRTLPDEQRAALVLRYLLDLSEEETAATLGVARGTVKSRCSRAISTLRAQGLLDDEPTAFERSTA
ncbi:MAG TPA: SigE family RNA polymerase sigma factor [Mycobacteriales bacterium]|nr:SigE family RNA polymerase sigma factor [Mycobacteriales bacterium]